MATGLPVVGPYAGGPRDLIAHCRTGFLLTPTIRGQAPAAIDALRDPAVRARFGAAGMALVRTRTWPSVCEELLDHYAAVLGGGGSCTDRRVTGVPVGPTEGRLPFVA